MAKIDILLATYNGERYLGEQLQSLETQSFADWRLIVRDDGSSDASLAIVRDWAKRCGRPVTVVEDGRKGLGACGNFGALLALSNAPYFALCDQDDVWLPEKLATMLARVEAAEASHGAAIPVLACSDLTVVNSALETIHPSFRAFSRIRPPRPDRMLLDLTIQNFVTGCAAMGNAALRQAAVPIPEETLMHDWWLAMVAAGLGTVVEVPETAILYRQHGANTLGAKSFSLFAALRRFLRGPRASIERTRTIIARTQRQASTFADRYAGRVDERRLEPIREYGALAARPFLHRKGFVIRHRLWTPAWLSNLTFLAAV